jgi:competence protein ComEC
MERAPSRLRVNFASLLARATGVVVLLSALGVATALTWHQARRPILAGGGELRVWFLDIGQGDATLIETPNGKQILVDGGPDQGVLAKLGALLPPTDRAIDAIVLTHPDADHVAGLVSVLDRYEVSTVFETGLDKDTKIARAFESARDAEGADRRLLRTGDRFAYDGVTFDVLWPDDSYDGRVIKEANRAGIVLLVRYGETSILLTADTDELEEAKYGKRAGDVDVLKVGHHGSKTSSSAEFLATVRPEFAAIMDGKDNRYGHPTPEALSRLARVGARIFRTDLDGDILMTSRGGEPAVSASPLPF